MKRLIIVAIFSTLAYACGTKSDNSDLRDVGPDEVISPEEAQKKDSTMPDLVPTDTAAGTGVDPEY